LPIQDTLVQNQLTGIKAEFLQNPGITAATTSYHVPGLNVGGGSVMWAEGKEGMNQQAFTLMFVGEDYFKTMGISLIDGREFQSGPNADVEDVFVVNEATVRLMGWGDDAIGKKVKFFHAEKDGQVIGVVKDFNFNSLHNPVEPLLIIKAREEGGFLHLKVKGENLPETMEMIKSKWSKFDPNNPYEYFFVDQRFNEQYEQDEVQHKLLSGLSYVCIFISLLGLLGLSAFTAAQRTKEIGVRKVHGATIPNIIFLLYKDVMYLVLIAAVLIIPVAYYIITEWMGNFAYRTELNYLTFIGVAAFAMLFAFLTVAFHSLRTARMNPVQSLKYE
jgi:putative ABC transport system permease protein